MLLHSDTMVSHFCYEGRNIPIVYVSLSAQKTLLSGRNSTSVPGFSSLEFCLGPKAYAASAPSALTINVQPYQSPFTVYEVGQAMSHVVATGTDSLGPGDPITATIDWGDKTTPTSQQVVSSANGAYQVSAMHTYSQAGSYPITISVKDSGH
jgi:hypothetical protein